MVGSAITHNNYGESIFGVITLNLCKEAPATIGNPVPLPGKLDQIHMWAEAWRIAWTKLHAAKQSLFPSKSLHSAKPSFSSLILQLKILGNKECSLLPGEDLHTQHPLSWEDLQLGKESLAWDRAHPRKPGNCCIGLAVNIKFWWEESFHVGTKPHVPEKTSAAKPKFKKELVQRAEIEASTCFGAKQPAYMKKSSTNR